MIDEKWKRQNQLRCPDNYIFDSYISNLVSTTRFGNNLNLRYAQIQNI